MPPASLLYSHPKFFFWTREHGQVTNLGMRTQNQVYQTLVKPANTGRVIELIEQMPDRSPSWIARTVCKSFGFQDHRQQLQQSTCLAALRKLERKGAIALPSSNQCAGGLITPVRLGHPVAVPEGVPSQVNEITDLSLELAESTFQRALWNELILEHPLGHQPTVGRLLRYLVRSEHGYLGALGFSSSAVALKPRDDWLGWDKSVRLQHLERVVSLSRFLIRPSVTCLHLASRVLGMVARRVKQDYRARYGLEILLLETFVDPSAHAGTCFRAANWIGVGQTQGRGRQDREQKACLSKKDIYMYPLDSHFRAKLGVSQKLKPLEIAEELGSAEWARKEFEGAQLGHASRTKRVIQMAEGKSRKPHASWLEVAEGDPHQLKAIYRLIEKPDDSPVTMEGILKGHQDRTMRRMAGQKVVLCPQDTTDLNLADLLACEGLGVIGNNQTGTKSKGLRLHSTLPLSSDGIPLGVLRADCYARPELAEEDKGRDGRLFPIEQKETYRWVQSVEACIEASKRMPETMIVNMCDREGDIFDVFDRVRGEPRVHVLVRAEKNRRTGEGLGLLEHVRASEPRGELQISVPRQSARRKKGNRLEKSKQAGRRARVELRYMACEVYPPKHGVNRNKSPVPAWIIHIREIEAPPDVHAIEWYLVSTLPVDSVETAAKLIRWYCMRWRIEDWHRILKSGCQVEGHAHQTGERIKRAIAIDLVNAYRILMMVLLGRELPELPAEVLFSDLELRVLQVWSKKKGRTIPEQTIGAYIAILAAMGGYLDRKKDGPVGPKILGRAYTRLIDFCEGFILAQPESRPEQEMGYG